MLNPQAGTHLLVIDGIENDHPKCKTLFITAQGEQTTSEHLYTP